MHVFLHNNYYFLKDMTHASNVYFFFLIFAFMYFISNDTLNKKKYLYLYIQKQH